MIACGPGNNGGDGAVVARHLDARGVAVRVLWFTDPAHLKGDAATQRDILGRSRIEAIAAPADAEELATLWYEADWVVDALLGTGLTRPVEGPIARAIASLNRSNKPILALDLPSGLDADSGFPLGDAVRARATATFVAPKLGFGKKRSQPLHRRRLRRRDRRPEVDSRPLPPPRLIPGSPSRSRNQPDAKRSQPPPRARWGNPIPISLSQTKPLRMSPGVLPIRDTI